MDVLIALAFLLWYLVGVVYFFRCFDPKTIGGIFVALTFGGLVGSLVLCINLLTTVLSIQVRK